MGQYYSVYSKYIIKERKGKSAKDALKRYLKGIQRQFDGDSWVDLCVSKGYSLDNIDDLIKMASSPQRVDDGPDNEIVSAEEGHPKNFIQEGCHEYYVNFYSYYGVFSRMVDAMNTLLPYLDDGSVLEIEDEQGQTTFLIKNGKVTEKYIEGEALRGMERIFGEPVSVAELNDYFKDTAKELAEGMEQDCDNGFQIASFYFDELDQDILLDYFMAAYQFEVNREKPSRKMSTLDITEKWWIRLFFSDKDFRQSIIDMLDDYGSNGLIGGAEEHLGVEEMKKLSFGLRPVLGNDLKESHWPLCVLRALEYPFDSFSLSNGHILSMPEDWWDDLSRFFISYYEKHGSIATPRQFIRHENGEWSHIAEVLEDASDIDDKLGWGDTIIRLYATPYCS